MAESDWSPYELTFTEAGKQKVQLFGYVLTHSTRKFYRGYLGYGVHELMAGHVANDVAPDPSRYVSENWARGIS